MIKWHRLLGLTLEDFFFGTAFEVELERDLSLKQQFLDVLIIRRRLIKRGGYAQVWPDGFENLSEHNLLTFKSKHEPLDQVALGELLGHYINYCKQLGRRPNMNKDRLFAVAVRYPRNLTSHMTLERVQPGVYRSHVVGFPITIIVTNRIPKSPRNALWNIFSPRVESTEFGIKNYKWKQSDHTTALEALFYRAKLEGIDMPLTLEQFQKEFYEEAADWVLGHYTPEQRMKGLSDEDRLEGVSDEKRLEGVSEEAVKAYLRSLRLKKTKS